MTNHLLFSGKIFCAAGSLFIWLLYLFYFGLLLLLPAKMKILRNPVFLFCLLDFVCNQVLEKNGVYLYFVHSFADDISCMPVLLSLASALLCILYSDKNAFHQSFRLSYFQIAFALVYAAVLFELILPHYSAKYVSDWRDVIAYAVGAFIFSRFINPQKTRAISEPI